MNQLPIPTTVRWQPLRLGLKNLYRYDDERFVFAGGRLLLRGNNGTGKTRVLALTLPFLLDGETRPARVEPDGNPGRRFEWHLLMDRWHERTGYAWIEFGRLDEGQPRYCTIGCGMRAVEGHQGLRGRWFFVSSLRVDAGLSLADSTGAPLPRDQLKEALHGHGTLYESAEAYRRAVDGALFNLGEQRYDALIKLLIELRRPQLSRELNEALLSSALSDALGQVDQGVLDDVAEGYRGLERDRDELHAIEASMAAVTEFNQIHRREVSMHAGRSADGVRSAHTRYEDAQGSVRAAVEGRTLAEAALTTATDRLRCAEDGITATEGALQALRASPEMKTATRLDRLLAEERTADSRGRDDTAEATRRVREADAAAQEDRQAHQRAAAAHVALSAASTAAHHAGTAIGVPSQDPEEPRVRQQRLIDAMRVRRDGAKVLRDHDMAVRKTLESRTLADQRVRDAEEQRDTALLSAEAAEDRLERARSAFASTVSSYLSGLHECQVDTLGVNELIFGWLKEPEERDPLTIALTSAAASRRHALAAHQSTHAHERGLLRREQDALDAEAERLQRGIDPGPPTLPWVDGAARKNRLGAALWRVVDFLPAIIAADRAGYEAALQASGLLDAWLHPDGQLEITADGGASIVRDGNSSSHPEHAGLTTVLTPAIDPSDDHAKALTDATITRALQLIGSRRGDGACWVAANGHWQNGPAHGAWMKTSAEHLGAGARAQARHQRLAAIAQRRAEIVDAIARIDTAIAAIVAAMRQVDSEVEHAPDAEAVRAPWRAAHLLAQQLSAARGVVALRQTQAAQQQAAWALAQEKRTLFAADCALTAWIDRAEGLIQALSRLELALRDLDHALAGQTAADEHAGGAAQRVAIARSAADLAGIRARDSMGDALRLRSELQELRDTQGAAIAEIQQRIQEAHERMSRCDGERKAIRGADWRGQTGDRSQRRVRGQGQGVARGGDPGTDPVHHGIQRLRQ